MPPPPGGPARHVDPCRHGRLPARPGALGPGPGPASGALAAARQAGDLPGQARALMLLANMQAMTGDLAAAAASLPQALAAVPRPRRPGRAGRCPQPAGLPAHWPADDYPAAAAISRRWSCSATSATGAGKAEALNGLGRVLADRGLPGCRRQPPAGAGAVPRRRPPARPGRRPHDLGAVQRLTGDYPAAAATLRQALVLSRDLGDRYKQAWVLAELAVVQRLTGDYRAAAASSQQALELFRDSATGQRGLRAQPTRPGAAADRRLPGRRRQPPAGPRAVPRRRRPARPGRDAEQPRRASVPDRRRPPGPRPPRPGAGHRPRPRHPLEEARALEGIGRSHLRDGHPSQAAAFLRQALAIYQRIGTPAARRVQETLTQTRQDHPAPEP